MFENVLMKQIIKFCSFFIHYVIYFSTTGYDVRLITRVYRYEQLVTFLCSGLNRDYIFLDQHAFVPHCRVRRGAFSQPCFNLCVKLAIQEQGPRFMQCDHGLLRMGVVVVRVRYTKTSGSNPYLSILVVKYCCFFKLKPIFEQVKETFFEMLIC